MPSQARMRMTITAFWQWWPARCRTRQSSFSSSVCLRITCGEAGKGGAGNHRSQAPALIRSGHRTPASAHRPRCGSSGQCPRGVTPWQQQPHRLKEHCNSEEKTVKVQNKK